MQSIIDNLERVREQLRAACRRAGRNPQEVRLVCVTKGQTPASIRAAWSAGIRIMGENRMQEAQAKRAALTDLPELSWHLIGHLQTNKVKLAVTVFHAVHSVDSQHLAVTLEQRCAETGTRLPVFLQVNTSGETSKHGVSTDEAEAVGRQLRDAAHLDWQGLMTIAPAAENPAHIRPVFRQLRALRDQLQRALHVDGLQLSMGMSHDFVIAVEEGADVVRIGSAIFQEEFWHGAS